MLSDVLMQFLIQCLNGIQYGLLLFLVSSGLTLIFGVMGVINLAHGSFYMLGAYLVYYFATLTGSLALAILISVPVSFFFGFVLEILVFRQLYKREHLYQVLLTYGLILVLEEMRSLAFGDNVHGVDIPALLNFSIPLTDTLSYPFYRIFLSLICIAIAGGLYLMIMRTRLGMIARAGSTNREMVQSLGININVIYRGLFALGVALAAFAGMIAAPVSSVFPGMGNEILIISFVVVVIGGIGSIKGAFIGSLMIGLANTFGQVFVPGIAGMVIYMLMAAILVWRPAGLFGTRI